MARYFKSVVLLLTVSISLLSSCQEGRQAGDLLGQWRMTGSDTHYISFSGSVTKIACISEGAVFGNFQHVGDSLFIQCYSAEALASDTTMVEQSFGFRPFNDIRLKIEVLSGNRLRLQKGQQNWEFYLY